MHGLFNGFGNFGMMGYGGYGYNGWSQTLLLGLVLIGLAIATSFLIRRPHKFHSDSGSNKALETLKRRYAEGEIDRETFEQMERDLR